MHRLPKTGSKQENLVFRVNIYQKSSLVREVFSNEVDKMTLCQ